MSSFLDASFSSFGCFVFEIWVLRLRVLGASFSSLGCFVFEIWVLRFRDLGASCFGLRFRVLRFRNYRSRDLNSKVELFNVFFHSVYSKSTTDVKLLATDVVNLNLLFEVTTTVPELEGILSKINVDKAPGVDDLPARVLRTCAKELSIPLAHLFNLSLRTGKNAHFMEISQYYPNS